MMPFVVDTSLVCLECRAPLIGAADEAGQLTDGDLRCVACSRGYPVVRGIPRVTPDTLIAGQERTASAFGWQWRHFAEIHPAYEAQFLDWIAPLQPEAFRGKRVLDAGCGIGRHARFAAAWGAQEVVALDLSAAVETARDALEPFQNVHVVQGDLLRPPLATPEEGGGFDLIYSIGVLHHLPNPEHGIRSLARLLKPGGLLAVWVYGHEGNRFVRRVIEPLRRLTTLLPPSALRLVAWPLAAVMYALIKLLYSPAARMDAGRRLPMAHYLSSLDSFGFQEIYTIVFDQLVAPTSHYIRGSELIGWLESAGLAEVNVSARNGNSWRGYGRRASVLANG